MTQDLETTVVDLNDPSLYINREISWVRFNARVLEEALDQAHPLLEQVKFLSIFSSNLDEFFMIRVSGLRRQLASGVLEAPPDGMTPAEQLVAIREELLPMLETQSTYWNDTIKPRLAEAGVTIASYADLTDEQQNIMRGRFEEEIFPVLTPLAVDPGRPFPHIANLSINLAVVVYDSARGERFARLKVPPSIGRFITVPEAEPQAQHGPASTRRATLVPAEELIAANLDLLFPGVDVVGVYPFRITRDADIEIEEDEASDLSVAVEEGVGLREFGSASRLEIEQGMPDDVRDMLQTQLGLDPYLVYESPGLLGLCDLIELTTLDRPDLKDEPFLPAVPADLQGDHDILDVLRSKSVLLYRPYDSFLPIVDFIRHAAEDPQVLAIKMTLYRIGANSPIVKALLDAREAGRQVAVLVELKARFDEENNLVWARALERAGVHVVYGLVGLKTHAKVTLIVRREVGGIRRYVHVSTGNYNPVTARVYTDLDYLTSDPDLADDASRLFNALTGYGQGARYRRLLVAPHEMREALLERIEREIRSHQINGNGYLAFKANALVDKRLIQALYRASRHGVVIDLQIRGICSLRPGVPGVSDTIRVTSVVGRFLEHARLYYFYNNGDDELLSGSADLMPRNLSRRVEVLFPLTGPQLELSRDYALRVSLSDNVKARELQADGGYVRVKPSDGEPVVDSQTWFLDHWPSREPSDTVPRPAPFTSLFRHPDLSSRRSNS